jgi:phage antirepressor YoqD-like protein
MTFQIIPHAHGASIIGQRQEDGYINATALCKASGKRFNHYNDNQHAKDYLAELERSAGIPANVLVQSIVTGPNEERGTWVHPQVAIHLGMWASPAFAVQVTTWVLDWMREGKKPDLSTAQQSDNMLVREAARLFGIKESELWVILRGDLGWLYHTNRRNVAYARTIAAGLMVHKIGHYTLPNGKIKETRTPVITPKGFRSLKAAMSERGYQLQGEQQTPAPAVERAPAPAKVADLPSVPARVLTDATAKMSWVHPTITVDLALHIDASAEGASDYALAMLSWVADARQAALA